jgi:hypothetical protein
MSAEVIYLAERQCKTRDIPEASGEECIEFRGDEIAVFVLHDSGDANAWISASIQTAAQWDHIFNFLKQIEAGLLQLRYKKDE